MKYIISLIFSSFITYAYAAENNRKNEKDAFIIFDKMDECMQNHDVEIYELEDFFEMRNLNLIDTKLKHWAHCYLEAVGVMKGSEVIDKKRYAGIPENLDQYDTAMEILKMNKKLHAIQLAMQKCSEKHQLKMKDVEALLKVWNVKPMGMRIKDWLECYIGTNLSEKENKEILKEEYDIDFNEYNNLLKGLEYEKERDWI
uniref:Uncharacterized protein n=1 Tax=Glossina brevipalpis TaxID=37001 RepID=A0A1A9X137_9MUSC